MTTFLILIGSLAAGAAGAFFWPRKTLATLQAETDEILKQAKEEAKLLHENTADKVAMLKRALAEEERQNEENEKLSAPRVQAKEEMVKKREERNQSIQNSLTAIQQELEKCRADKASFQKEMITVLSKVSGMNSEEALEKSRAELDELIAKGREGRLQAELDEWAEDISRHAKAVLQIVIQRLGVPSSVDKNNTLVMIAHDAFKGMLIGKEAKNIEYLESKLPVFVIFNHGGDPKTLNVAGVNLLRRNIAKRAIEKMEKWVKKSGSIDHAMIDRALEEADKEIMAECDKWGDWALKQMHIDPKTVPADLRNYVGRLYFRTSYGQNIIGHSLEMGHAARMIAELIGTNVPGAEFGAFYHDIGKAIDHDVGGSHDELSRDILDQHGFDPEIVHAAYAHHDKAPCESPSDFIVKAVDAISGGRPGARMESVTNYFERMQELTAVAESFQGVAKVLTMAAGREVRVMVDKDRVQDDDMDALAGSIAQKISDDLAFPGLIKVNVVRQTKAVDHAREQKTHK